MSENGSAALQHLNVVILGHVDHGKSTLIGRLFYDTGSLPDGRYEKIKAACEARGMRFEWAFLTDGLQAERDQNITIDTSQVWFRTPKREYVIIDAPGHKELLKNMVTGAASADAALIMVDACEGIQEQSRRHGYLAHLLGVQQLSVIVNKMDLVDFSAERLSQIEADYRAFLTQLGVHPRHVIPISARDGDNVASPSSHMPWYHGPTVLEALDELGGSEPPDNLPLRFPIQDVYRFDERRILAGRIEAGVLRVGDEIVFSPRNETSRVKSIESWPEASKQVAVAGESVGITLTQQVFVTRGQVASHLWDPPMETDVFSARLFWLGRRSLEVGRRIKLKLATQEVDCHIQSIEKLLDPSTLDERCPTDDEPITRNEVAEVVIRTRAPIAFDGDGRVPSLARFVLVDDRLVCGGGVLSKGQYPDRRPALTRVKSDHVFWTFGQVTREDRERRNRHKGAVVWLTGLSGSGKSTIATELERELFNQGLQTYVLDGDNIRHGLSANLGFDPEDRAENIRRVVEVAKLFADAGILVITAFISPYRDDRRLARATIHDNDFIEVYVDAPLHVCEQRDPKGLYREARAGRVASFTGIDAPYEPPEYPELVVHTDRQTVGESTAEILGLLKARCLEPAALAI